MRTIAQWIVLIIGFLGSLCSIVSIVLLCVSVETSAHMALLCVCLFLLAFLVILIWGILRISHNENNLPHKRISIFATFETIDSTHSTYETYRVIQSKRLILTHFDHEFKWSGTKEPLISSSIQKVGKIEKGQQGEYDSVRLILKTPLLYNENTTLHFKAELDDVDNKAKPYLDFKVDMPINLISYRVILKNKPNDFCKPAFLSRKLINTDVPAEYEKLGSVQFDNATKSYQYTLIEPEVGYYYRLEWEK